MSARACRFPYVGDVQNPVNHRWSLGFQRELPWQLLIEATYVGAHGVNLPVTRQLNAVPQQYFSTSPVRDDATNNRLSQQVPNPFVGAAARPASPARTSRAASCSGRIRSSPRSRRTETNGQSDYNALQARVERRMANGFTVQMAYAWSRAMTETGYLNDSDTELERVISQWDREHTFVSSGLVELPFGRNRRYGRGWGGVTNALLGGWQVSYIFKAQSGAPLGFGNFLFAEGMGVDDITPVESDRSISWFNVNAFNRVTGTAAGVERAHSAEPVRRSARTGYAVLDLGLLKNFSLGGSRQPQFRVEAYNALNRANLQNPNTATTSTALGTITAQNGLPRQLQLAVKVSF